VDAQGWVAVIVGVMAILSGLYAGVRFIVRSIMHEIGPQANGSSLKEQVNRLENRIDHIYKLLTEN
jgi:uncharacterized protein YneF (UPF0154 family)